MKYTNKPVSSSKPTISNTTVTHFQTHPITNRELKLKYILKSSLHLSLKMSADCTHVESQLLAFSVLFPFPLPLF